MGRNKDLREKIAGRQSVIEEHQQKIREERMKPHPDEEVIAGWQHEIATQRAAIARLSRRLTREW
jgi:hypothetical protein